MALQKKKRNIILKGKYKLSQLKKLNNNFISHIGFGLKFSFYTNTFDKLKKNINVTDKNICNSNFAYFFFNCSKGLYFFFNFFKYNNFFANSIYDYSRIKHYSNFLKNNTFVISFLTFHDYLISLFFLKIYNKLIVDSKMDYTKISKLEKKQTVILLDKIRSLMRWFFYFIDFLNFLIFDFNFIKLSNLSYFFNKLIFKRISLSNVTSTLSLFNNDYSIDKIYFNKGVSSNTFTNTLSSLIMRRYTMISSPIFDDIEFRYKIPGDLYSNVIKNVRDLKIVIYMRNIFKVPLKKVSAVLYLNYINYIYLKYSLVRLKRLSNFPTLFIKKLRIFSKNPKSSGVNFRRVKLAYHVKSVNEKSYKPWRIFFLNSHLRCMGYNNYVDFSYFSNNIFMFRDHNLDQNLYIDLEIPVWSFHVFFSKEAPTSVLNFKNKFIFSTKSTISFFDNYFDIGKLRLLFRTILLYYSIFLDKQLWLTKGWFSFISYKEKFSKKVLKFLVKSYNYIKNGIKTGSRNLHSDIYHYLRSKGINFMPYSSAELFFFRLNKKLIYMRKGLSKNLKKKSIFFFLIDAQDYFFFNIYKFKSYLVFKKFSKLEYSFKYSYSLMGSISYFFSNIRNPIFNFLFFFFRRFFILKPKFRRRPKLFNIKKLNISDKVTVLSYNKQFYLKDDTIYYSKFLNFKFISSSRTHQTLYFLFKSNNYAHRNHAYFNLSSRNDVFRITKYYSFKDIVLEQDFFNIMTFERNSVKYISFYCFIDFTHYFYRFYAFFYNYNIFTNRVNFFTKILATFNFFKLFKIYYHSLSFFKLYFSNYLFIYFYKNTNLFKLMMFNEFNVIWYLFIFFKYLLINFIYFYQFIFYIYSSYFFI